MCVPSVILDSTGTVYHSRDCWGQDQCERRESDPSVSSTFYPCRKWKSTLTSWVEQSTWKWMRLLASIWPEFLLRWGNSMKLWLRRTVRMLRRGSSPRYSHTNEPHSNASALPPWQGPTALSQNDWFLIRLYVILLLFFLSDWWTEPWSCHPHPADTDRQVRDHGTAPHPAEPGDRSPVAAQHGTELPRAHRKALPHTVPFLPCCLTSPPLPLRGTNFILTCSDIIAL